MPDDFECCYDGEGAGNGDADNNIGGHPKGAAAGAAPIIQQRHEPDSVGGEAECGHGGQAAHKDDRDAVAFGSSLRRRRRTEIPGVRPGCNSYNTVIKAYANTHGTRGEDRISNVERILFPHIIDQ